MSIAPEQAQFADAYANLVAGRAFTRNADAIYELRMRLRKARETLEKTNLTPFFWKD